MQDLIEISAIPETGFCIPSPIFSPPPTPFFFYTPWISALSAPEIMANLVEKAPSASRDWQSDGF